MPDHSTQFKATSGGLVLTNAILLYRNAAPRNANAYGAIRQEAVAFASIHRVEQDDAGRSTIAAGTPLSHAHLRQWTEALGKAVRPEILPDNVLVAHTDMLAWWIPAQVRPAYFALSAPPADLQVLSKRTIVPVPYPAHLFVATRTNLGVYALPVNERPVANTKVLYSPVLNVFVDGQLCWGNIPRPKTLTIASIADFERAVFDSWSTHPNPGQELTVTRRGGLVRLWDDLAARRAKRFPVGRLKPFTGGARRQAWQRPNRAAAGPMTVGRLVAESA